MAADWEEESPHSRRLVTRGFISACIGVSPDQNIHTANLKATSAKKVGFRVLDYLTELSLFFPSNTFKGSSRMTVISPFLTVARTYLFILSILIKKKKFSTAADSKSFKPPRQNIYASKQQKGLILKDNRFIDL